MGTFLIGLKMMGDNLQNIAGDRLKLLFNKVSNNKFMGIATGAGITAVIQSSSATTVMIVGFVNAGMMTLKQATSIIMGANIGTTITAQITALQSLPITPFLTAFACVGAFMAMFGKDKIAKAGMLISGIGIIFVGMRVMSTSMDDVSKSPEVINLLASVTHPLLLMLIGLVFTAVFQSSAATTSILITLCSVSLDEGGQLMTLQSAIFVTLGINIGTCVTAMLASIGANTNAKRASVIHLLFNVFGTAIFLIFIFIAPLISEKLAIHYWLAKVFPNVVSTQIAMFHTIFNILSTLILLPFTGGLTKLATILVREKKNNQEEEKDKIVAYIDERILKSPSIALMVLRKELLSMAFLAKTNFDLSIET
ncbi:MAG: Na/Pi symporter, partial [Clostridia bacterium]|nr:Na/Pi symporter [Clostridia bacterium]